MLEAVKILKSRKMLDCLVMLHFHIGSQITDIRKIKEAIREAGRVYAKLRGLGVPIQYLNLGGGLGVDYDGSKTAFDSSMNYSVQEYANDVVYTVKQICDEEKVPAPVLVTESGRAVTAYHSVFVTNVLDVADRIEQGRRVTRRRRRTRPSCRSSPSIYETVNAKTLRESYHDALQYKEELFTLFNLGHLSLEDRSKGEILFWQICEKIHRDLKTLKEIPEEFEDMETMLADKYVLNFSVFQSLPDIWAIDQLFPILPIHRLNERPDRVRHARRHHVRLRRQDREVHRPARHQGDAAAARSARRRAVLHRRLPDGRVPGRPRRPAQPLRRGHTRSSSPSTSRARRTSTDVLPGESCERVLEYMNYDRDRDPRLDRPAAARASPAAPLKKDEARAIYQEFEDVFPRVHVPGAMRRCGAAFGIAPRWRRLRAAAGAGAARAPRVREVWRVGVFEAPPVRDERARRPVARPRRSISGRRSPPRSNLHVPPRRGVPRRDPRRHRAAAASHVAPAPFAATIDASSWSTSPTPTCRRDVGIAVRRSGDEDRWLAVAARARDAHGAPALRRHRVPDVFVAGAVALAARAAAQPAVLRGRAQGLGSGSGGPA